MQNIDQKNLEVKATKRIGELKRTQFFPSNLSESLEELGQCKKKNKITDIL